MRSHSSKRFLVLALALAFGATACASGGGSSRPAGATTNRIVKEELTPLGTINALQAIERLRPRWLQSRAGTGGELPVLYVDGARRSNVQDLNSLQAMDIEQMEYMSGSDATTRYGTGHSGGAILVTSIR